MSRGGQHKSAIYHNTRCYIFAACMVVIYLAAIKQSEVNKNKEIIILLCFNTINTLISSINVRIAAINSIFLMTQKVKHNSIDSIFNLLKGLFIIENSIIKKIILIVKKSYKPNTADTVKVKPKQMKCKREKNMRKDTVTRQHDKINNKTSKNNKK